MTTHKTRALLDGELAVYPGHPITLAYMIARSYPDIDAVLAPSRDPNGTPLGWCVAVGDINIPGAGGNVQSAVDLLTRVAKTGVSVTEAFALADTAWSRCDDQKTVHPGRWSKGQEQADRVKDKLREILLTWTPSAPSAP